MVQFVVKDEITFKAKVFIVMPTEDGKKSTLEVKGLFKLVKQDEVDDLARQLNERAKAGEDPGNTQVELLSRALAGWEGIVNEDGTIFDFTDANRDKLLNIQFVRLGFWNAYVEAVNGQAKRGN